MHVCACVCMCVCVDTPVCARVDVHTCVCLYVCARVSVCAVKLKTFSKSDSLWIMCICQPLGILQEDTNEIQEPFKIC